MDKQRIAKELVRVAKDLTSKNRQAGVKFTARVRNNDTGGKRVVDLFSVLSDDFVDRKQIGFAFDNVTFGAGSAMKAVARSLGAKGFGVTDVSLRLDVKPVEFVATGYLKDDASTTDDVVEAFEGLPSIRSAWVD